MPYVIGSGRRQVRGAISSLSTAAVVFIHRLSLLPTPLILHRLEAYMYVGKVLAASNVVFLVRDQCHEEMDPNFGFDCLLPLASRSCRERPLQPNEVKIWAVSRVSTGWGHDWNFRRTGSSPTHIVLLRLG